MAAPVPRRERVTAVRGAWMHAASWLVISFFTLSRSIGKIFCTNASSCCLNSSAGYLASTCTVFAGFGFQCFRDCPLRAHCTINDGQSVHPAPRRSSCVTDSLMGCACCTHGSQTSWRRYGLH